MNKILLMMTLSLSVILSLQAADLIPLECDIVQITQDEIYVNKGSESGIQMGDRGTVYRKGSEINQVKVLHVTRSSSRFEILKKQPQFFPKTGDKLVILVTPKGAGDESSAKEEFVPLLAPPQTKIKSQSQNIAHGQVRMRVVDRQLENSNQDYTTSKIGLDGNLVRIGGSSWALHWFGDVLYRDGQAYSGTDHYQKADLNIFNLNLQRKISGTGFFRMGRFSPNEISGFGYLDGGHAEIPFASSWALGILGGYRPDPMTLSMDSDRLNGTGYLNFKTDPTLKGRYFGTVGISHDFFENELDRRALLVDQQFVWDSKHFFNFSYAGDFDVNAATFSPSGFQTTRLNTYLVSNLSPIFTLRGGYDEYRDLITEADQEFLGPTVDSDMLDSLTTRAWIGSSLKLFWDLTLDEDVTFLGGSNSDSVTRWRASVAQQNFLRIKNARMEFSSYNVVEDQENNYAGGLSFQCPLLNNKYWIYALTNMRTFNRPEEGEQGLKTTDYSVRLDGRISRQWRIYLNYAHTYAIYTISDLIDAGLDYRF